MREQGQNCLREAIDIPKQAQEHGSYPFGQSKRRFHRSLNLTCAAVMACDGRSVEVVGPLLEEEARSVHLGFWES